MKNINLRTRLYLLLCLLCLTGCIFSEKSDEPDSGCLAEILSGKIGELSWSLCEGGVLTISGNGEIIDYESSTHWPKYPITSVIIKKGVTSIGYNAFGACESLTSVSIPNSVT